MKIPTPQEIGLPEKFERWRPQQEESLRVIITSKKRAKGNCSPTGSGKSAVNVAAALLSRVPTCLVTQSKGLQDQYLNEFQEIGMVDLRGRDNYPCGLKEEYTCEDGYAARCPYKGSISCPASQAEMRAATSSLVVTNFAKWTASKRHGHGMDHFKQVIFDEGHYAPEALAKSMQVRITPHEINEVLGIDFPPYRESTDMIAWKNWAGEAKAVAEVEMMAMRDKVLSARDPRPSWVKKYNHLKNLVRRITTIRTAGANNWIVDEIEDSKGFVFDPIRPGRYAEAMLLLAMPSILFTSATLRPKTLHMCGLWSPSAANNNDRLHKNPYALLETEHYAFKEYESDFSPEDSPIYYVPTMRVDSKATDLSMLYILIHQIAAPRQHMKGAIHTISYQRRDDIIANCRRFAHNMIINEKGEAPTEMVELFKDSPMGKIIVTPSISTGYDFPGDELEWAFMSKVPFEPPSRIVKAREADDKEYRGYKAIQYMDQGFGRGNRFKGDRCQSFIGDDHMAWFIPKFGHLASRSFHRRLRIAQTLPPPLPKMVYNPTTKRWT